MTDQNQGDYDQAQAPQSGIDDDAIICRHEEGVLQDQGSVITYPLLQFLCSVPLETP